MKPLQLRCLGALSAASLFSLAACSSTSPIGSTVVNGGTAPVACNDLQVTETTAAEGFSSDEKSAPPAMGGEILPGTYVGQSVITYDGKSSPDGSSHILQKVLVLEGMTASFLTHDATTGEESKSSATYATVGTNVTFTPTCPAGGVATTMSYSSGPTDPIGLGQIVQTLVLSSTNDGVSRNEYFELQE